MTNNRYYLSSTYVVCVCVCVYRLFSLSFFLLWIYTLVKMCVSCDPPPTFSRSFLPSLFHVVYKVARLSLYICVYRRAGGGGSLGVVSLFCFDPASSFFQWEVVVSPLLLYRTNGTCATPAHRHLFSPL
jgi:hypothetical protein